MERDIQKVLENFKLEGGQSHQDQSLFQKKQQDPLHSVISEKVSAHLSTQIRSNSQDYEQWQGGHSHPESQKKPVVKFISFLFVLLGLSVISWYLLNRNAPYTGEVIVVPTPSVIKEQGDNKPNIPYQDQLIYGHLSPYHQMEVQELDDSYTPSIDDIYN